MCALDVSPQAAKLCPQLTQSCPPAALQQLCDTVKQGLVLVNGHSFLIGQVRDIVRDQG